MTEPDDTTRMLNRLVAESEPADRELTSAIYGELRRLAVAHMAGERGHHTLQPTALVNEAYLRLVGANREGFEGRRQFYALASRIMRSLLVDHARRKQALKRGGEHVAVPLHELQAAGREPSGPPAVEVLDVHAALEELALLDADLARIVELRWFGGLSMREVGETLGMTRRMVERRWLTASAWLHDRLDDRAGADDP